MKIREQLAWEQEAIERGTQKYYDNQDRLRDKGNGDQTDVVSHILKERLIEVAARIEILSNKHKGNGGNYNRLLKQTAIDGDFMRVAYIGAKMAFQILMSDRRNTVLKLALKIAACLEADLKCRIFENAYPGYYNAVMKSFKEQSVTDYTHKHKVMMKKFGDFDLNWNDWEPAVKGHIGSKVLKCVMEEFSDVLFINKRWSRGRCTSYLDSTVEFDDWAAEFEKEKGFTHPVLLPLKIPPMAWTGERGVGGYYTPAIANRLPFIKTRGRDHALYVNNHVPRKHMQAVNKMQRTAWCINRSVYAVQKSIYEKGLEVGIPSNVALVPPEFPEHLCDIDKEHLTDPQKEEVKQWKIAAKRVHQKEQERKGKVVGFMQTYKLASELHDWEEFFFVYTCDFRGRVYCATSGLTPQGNDVSKSLITFAKRVELGRSGLRWLAIHGANTYGEDKLSYTDRIKWVESSEREIRRVVEDPIGAREWWGSADKPYQFLAFCYEWAGASYGADPTYKSSLPVGMDGSCNGLQHYSALLRDEVGAHATNLLPCTKPEDLYERVAEVARQQLSQVDDERAAKWLHVGITRKCTKRPVMTLPYGATQQSARKYILEYAVDNWGKFNMPESEQWDMAKFLTPYVWSAIGQVVIAARAGMNFLVKNTTCKYMKWLTPLEFPVFQYYKEVDSITITTQLNGSISMNIRDSNQDGIPHKRVQKSGIAPNFIHSIDSTHMVMTINNTDLPAYAMIHDDFGTHAGNADILARAIRKSFKELYTRHDPIQEWADQQGVFNTLERGTYDINQITEAEYFFG